MYVTPVNVRNEEEDDDDNDDDDMRYYSSEPNTSVSALSSLDGRTTVLIHKK